MRPNESPDPKYPNLWPQDLFLDPELLTPVSILREQADYLPDHTKQKICARVNTRMDKDQISADFVLSVKAGYQQMPFHYTVFTVRYSIDKRVSEKIFAVIDHQGQLYECSDEDNFLESLKKVLGSERMKTVLSNLMPLAEK